MYVEIYEVLWQEAVKTNFGAVTAMSSQRFQRVFFNYEEAKEFEQKYIKAGLNPTYIKLKIHKMPVKKEGETND